MPGHSAAAGRKFAATLIYQWDTVFAWLAEKNPTLWHSLSEVIPNAEESTHCPIHGGESGEAFHVYPDFHETGGGVCNSCGSFATGYAFLRKLGERLGAGYASTLKAALAAYIEEHGLTIPAAMEQVALYEWVRCPEREAGLIYLSHRGIPNLRLATLPSALRAIRTRGPDGSGDSDSGPLPQMRVLFSKEGVPLTVQRIMLSPDCRQKNSEVDTPKKFYPVSRRGLSSGSYADLSDPDTDRQVLYAGEGVETMMAVRALLPAGAGRFHALGGAANRYGDLWIPEGVTEVHLCGERDHTLPNLQRSVEQLQSRGMTVFVHVPPENSGSDWLDALTALGIVAASEAFRVPEPLPAGTAMSAGSTAGEGAHRESRVSAEGPIPFNLDCPDAELFEFLDETFPLFARDSWYLHLVVPETMPIRVAGAILEPLNDGDMAAAISEKVAFYLESRGEMRYQQTPKGRVANWFQSALARGFFDSRLRPLKDMLFLPAIVSYQEFDEAHPAGVLRYRFLHQTGYDAVSKFLLLPDPVDDIALNRARKTFQDFRETAAETTAPDWGDLSGDPARTPEAFGLEAAGGESPRWDGFSLTRFRRAFLNSVPNLIQDFRFAQSSDYANALALFLAPLVAPSCQNLPFFLIQAPARGAGKTTLAQAFGNLWGDMLQIAAPDSDEEMEKRMGTAFTTGKRRVLLDNLNRLDSPALTNLLTSGGQYEIRKLGSNQSLKMPSGLLLLGTGNNPVVQHELARRIVFIDLDPPADIVTSRVAFQYRDLPGFVRNNANQVEFRQALYTCILAWEAMGFPLLGENRLNDGGFMPKFESFSEFAQLITTFLFLFFPGNLYQKFQGNQNKYLDADAESDEITQFVAGWVRELEKPDLLRCVGEPNWFPVSSLLELATRLQLPSQIIEYRHTDSGKIRRLGMWLSRLSNRRFPIDGNMYRIHRHPSMLNVMDAEGVPRRTRAYALERVVESRARPGRR